MFSLAFLIENKVLSSTWLLRYVVNISSGYKSKSFKKILKSTGPKMNPLETPTIISDETIVNIF